MWCRGGGTWELTVEGVFFSHDERYENADEFLTVWRKLMQDATVDFRGKHIRVEGARNFHPAVQKPYPHLDETIRFAKLVFPLIGKAGVTTGGSQTGGVFEIRASISLQKSAS